MSNQQIYIPVATSDEIEDKDSWINTKYQIPHGQYDSFCHALGEAMFGWGKVESELYAIFAISLGASDYRPMHAAWFAVDSFRARLDMVNRVHNVAHLDGAAMETWNKLVDRCRKKSARRNALAHGQLYYEHNALKESRKFFVATPSPKGTIDRRDYLYDVMQLKRAFLGLAQDLSIYYLGLSPGPATQTGN